MMQTKKCYLFILCVIMLLTTTSSIGQTPDTLLANQLYEEGQQLGKDKKYEEAIAKLETAAKIHLAAKKNKAYYNDITRMIHIYNKTKDQIRIEFGKQVLIDVETIFGANSMEYSHILHFIGVSYIFERDLETSLSYLLACQKIAEQHLPENHIDIIKLYNDLGSNFLYQEKFDKAAQYYQSNLKKLAESQPESRDIVIMEARTLLNIGIINKEMAAYDEAVSYYDQAIQKNEFLNDTLQIGIVHYNAGFAYQLNGDLEKALDRLFKTEVIFIDELGEDHAYMAIVYNMIATTFMNLRRFDEAKPYLQKALQNNYQRFGKDHIKSYVPLNSLSTLAIEMGNCLEALPYIDEINRILSLQEEVLPSHERGVYKLRSQYYECQNQIDSAIYWGHKLIDSCDPSNNSDKNDFVENYTVMARYFEQNKDYPQMLAYAQKALIAGTNQFDSAAIEQNPNLDDILYPEYVRYALAYKAISLVTLAKQNSSHERLIPYSLKTLQLLDDCLAIEQELKQEEVNSSNHSSLQGYVGQLEAGVYVAACNYQHQASVATLDNCFQWMEKKKGRRLLHMTKVAEAKKLAGISGDLLQKDKQQAKAISDLEIAMIEALEANDTTSFQQIRSEELFALKQEREQFITNLEQEYPNYFELKYQSNTLGLSAIQGYLTEGDALIEISSINSEEDNLNFLIATSKKAELVTITVDIGMLQEKTKQLRKLLQSASLVRKDKRKQFIELSHALYQSLIAPIAEQIEGVQRLIIIGEGFTNLIPFEVLLASDEDKAFQDLDFLIKGFEISYHYSANLWIKSVDKKQQAVQKLLAFAPVFAKEGSNEVLSQTTRAIVDTTLRAFTPNGNFTPLLHSEVEVKAIEQLFKEKGIEGNRVLTYAKANEAALKEAIQEDYDIVHLASHSFPNLQRPKFSGIACSKTAGEDDGFLFVGEIYNLDISANLVVLSSCESGIGDLVEGEGMLGLNRSFIYAGVPNVLFSLWKINDKTTSELMIDFYKNRFDGQSYSKALRSAKLNMLQNELTASPNFWSGFLLMGR